MVNKFAFIFVIWQFCFQAVGKEYFLHIPLPHLSLELPYRDNAFFGLFCYHVLQNDSWNLVYVFAIVLCCFCFPRNKLQELHLWLQDSMLLCLFWWPNLEVFRDVNLALYLGGNPAGAWEPYSLLGIHSASVSCIKNKHLTSYAISLIPGFHFLLLFDLGPHTVVLGFFFWFYGKLSLLSKFGRPYKMLETEIRLIVCKDSLYPLYYCCSC